jgi:formyl-CoA transferase
VIKVEDPNRGDSGRVIASPANGEDGMYFLFLNANKKSITLNLKTEKGKDIMGQLITKADIFMNLSH